MTEPADTPPVPEGFELIDDQGEGAVGPPALLLAGFSPDEALAVRALLGDLGAPGHRVVCCTGALLAQTLEAALTSAPADAPLAPSMLPRVAVLSGLTDARIGATLDRWSETGLPRPIFACATPTSLGFTVKRLLGDLWREHQALTGGGPPPTP